MSNTAVEKVVFDADTAGLDRATTKVAQLERLFSQLGTKVPAQLRAVAVEQDKIAAATEKAAAAIRREQDIAAKRAASFSRQAEQTRRQYDESYKNAVKYAAEEARINKIVEAGKLSRDEANKFLLVASERYGQVSKSATVANDNLKLTGNQLKNLAFQGNDAVTMLLSGSSAFQVLATQGGQVFQALGDHPNGVAGSMKAIGTSALGLLTPVNLVAAGLVAAAAAGIYFSFQTKSKIKPLNEALEAHRKIVQDVADSYGVALSASDKYSSRSEAAFALRRSEAELKLSSRRSVFDSFLDTTEFMRVGRDDQGRDAPRVTEKYKAFAEPLLQLRQGIKAGAPDVEAFVKSVADIANLDPSNKKLGDLAQKMIDLAGPAAEASRQLNEFSRAQEQLQASRLGDAMSSLRDFAPDRTSQADKINAEAEKAALLARSYGELMEIERQRTAALGELDRQESNRRAGYELDLRSITAKTAADRADIAAERERLAVAGENISEAEKARRVEEARSLSLSQSSHEVTEAMRQRTEAGQAQVEAAQFELTLLGQTTGETARLRAEYDMMAAAKQAAKDAGTLVDPSEVDAIKAQAAAIGEATAALEKQNFERDVQFRLAQAGRSEQDQRIAAELYSSGIDFNSQEGQSRGAVLRYADAVEKAGDAMRDLREGTKDGLSEMIQAFGRGESAIESFIGAFSQVGSKLFSAGFDKLFGGLLNEGQSASAVTTKLNTVAAAANVPVKSSIERYALPPLSASNAVGSSPQVKVWQFFQSKGLSNVAIAGIMGNVHAESAFNAKAVGDSGKALGLFQWNDRAQNLKDFAGDWTDMNSQLEFAWKELNTSERGVLDRLKNSTSVAEATQAFLGFERPRGYSASDPTRSHNYSGRLSAAEASYNNYGNGVTSKEVSEGVIDANRKMATGAVPIPTSRPSAAENGIGIDPGKIDRFSGGMQALGAGLGIFSQGFQSQSPLMGGVTGAISGVGASASLAAAFGLAAGPLAPVGAAVGAIVGAVGGLFGKKSAKKAANKQKWAQAEEAWQQNLPAFRQLEDEVTRTERGPLSSKIKEMQETLKQFDDLAKKGKGDRNNDQIRRVRAEMADYIAFLSDNFTRDLSQIINDLGEGQGLDTSFTKARDAVMTQADSYRGFMKDIEDAYAVPVEQKDSILAQYAAASAAAKALTNDVVKRGYDYNLETPTITRTKSTATTADVTGALDAAASTRDAALSAFQAKYGDAIRKRDEALAAAQKAGQEGLLRIVSGDTVEQSDIKKAIAEAQGAASGLRTALVDLGMSADEAAVAIDRALGQRMEKLRDSFTESLQDKMNDLDGKGYLASVRELIKQRDDLLKDASLVNVDTSLVDTFFTKQAQAFVDGAELTGGAFNDLIAAFPELTGKVKEFVEAVTDETVKSGLSSFLSDRLADATSKRAEAESDLLSAYNETKDWIGTYQGQIRNQLTAMRLSDDSPLSQKDQFLEAQTKFRDVSTRALSGDKGAQEELVAVSESYREEAKAYYASSENYFAVFNEVEGVLKSADVKATSQLDLMKTQVGSLVDIKDNTKTIAEAIDALTDAISAQQKLQNQVDGGRSFGINKERNRLIDAGVKQLGLNFTGNYGVTNGTDEFLKWRLALPKEQLAAVDAVINQYIGINRQMGGLIPGYVDGGVIGNGTWNKDSVLARFRNGGYAALAGGEHVTRATSVTPSTYPVLEAINRTGKLPASANGNDNAARLDRVESLLRALLSTTGAGLDRVAAAQERTSAASEDMAATQRRRAS